MYEKIKLSKRAENCIIQLMTWGELKTKMEQAGVTDSMRLLVHGENKHQYDVDVRGVALTYADPDTNEDEIRTSEEKEENAVRILPWS